MGPMQIGVLLLLISSFAWGQSYEAPVVGRKAASKYFQRSPNKDFQETEVSSSSSPLPEGQEVLMLSLGSFIRSESFFWASQSYQNIGKANYGVTYLFDRWKGLDRHFRFEFQEYEVAGHSPRKLAIMPIITFPRTEKKFPLYFGFGLGLGLFFQQIPGESNLSLDYQLVAGTRFFDLFDKVGVFAEIAMKNHLHILSDGQFNGTALNTGLVFSF